MADVIPARMSAEIEGDFVVFVIGMRINKFWKFHRWLPTFVAMPRLLKELAKHPESGYLGNVQGGFLQVQYWRSFEQLEAYARGHDREHWPAWMDFNKRIGKNRGDVGIWHETYLVSAGQYEAIYSGMPRWGLGRVGSLVPASGRKDSARGRVGENGQGSQLGGPSSQ